jgi:hypothetical protein
MGLTPVWLTTILGFVVVLALTAEGNLHADTSVDLIDCRYENPELHIYMDGIESCWP